jgi:hypothetical protein
VPAEESVTVTAGPLSKAALRLRLLNEFDSPPVSTATLQLGGSLFTASETLVLRANEDVIRSATGTSETDTITLRNPGRSPVWISAVFDFDATVDSPRWRMSLMTDKPPVRSGHIVSEGRPLSPLDPQGDVEFVVEDFESGLRFLPPLEISEFKVRSGGSGGDEISLRVQPAPGTSWYPPDFLGGISVQTGDTLAPGSWLPIDVIPVKDAPVFEWHGILPGGARRFIRAVGLPTEE